MTRRNRTVVALARPYIRLKLRRAFDGVYVNGYDTMRRAAEAGPVLVAANHVCWWDALTILAIDEPLAIESHCLMDAANLRRMPFFGWLGAVPLERSSPRASVRDLGRAATWLDGAGKALWIFPQGEQRPAHVRPLGMAGGVRWLARKTRATVVPLALNYLFREAPEPAIVASFGAPLSASDGSGWLADLESALAEELARIDRFVMSGVGSFEEILTPRRSPGVPATGRLLAAFMSRDEETQHG